MRVRQHIPNLLTTGNLICGCLGIVYANQYSIHLSAYFIWIAGVFDFFDGYAARKLKVSSELGKQLDSLADVVSFGVLPAIMMFTLLRSASQNDWLAYGAFLMVISAAMRLGQFNSDEQQQHFFIGLPTPANALFVSGLIFLPPPFAKMLSNVPVLLGIVVLLSYSMIMPIRLFSLKSKNFNRKTDKIRLIFVALSILLLILYRAKTISLIILLYILLSLVENWGRQKKVSTNP